METMGMVPRRRRRRGLGACERNAAGRAHSGGGNRADDTPSVAVKTAMRAVVAAGTYVAQDVRDPDGLTRPLLRRAALRMAVSRQPVLRRLGAAYLRTDPPALPAAAGPPPLSDPVDAGVIDVPPAARRQTA